VVDQDTREILGAHMVGPESSEVIAQVVLAMEAGIGYRQLLRPHHLHPSMAEVGWPGHPLGRPRQECVIDARPNGASGALDRSPRSTAVGAWSHTAMLPGQPPITSPERASLFRTLLKMPGPVRTEVSAIAVWPSVGPVGRALEGPVGIQVRSGSRAGRGDSGAQASTQAPSWWARPSTSRRRR